MAIEIVSFPISYVKWFKWLEGKWWAYEDSCRKLSVEGLGFTFFCRSFLQICRGRGEEGQQHEIWYLSHSIRIVVGKCHETTCETWHVCHFPSIFTMFLHVPHRNFPRQFPIAQGLSWSLSLPFGSPQMKVAAPNAKRCLQRCGRKELN